MSLSPFNPLLSQLPLNYVVKLLYDGDYDTAQRHAKHLRHTHARPPQWVNRFLGPKPGWRHPSTRRVA